MIKAILTLLKLRPLSTLSCSASVSPTLTGYAGSLRSARRPGWGLRPRTAWSTTYPRVRRISCSSLSLSHPTISKLYMSWIRKSSATVVTPKLSSELSLSTEVLSLSKLSPTLPRRTWQQVRLALSRWVFDALGVRARDVLNRNDSLRASRLASLEMSEII